MTTPEFRFSAPDRRRMWRQLALTMSQASTLTGVSERQIQHWMDKGYINPAPDGTRKIGGESLDAIMLIKEARAAGIPLRLAAPMARDYLDREATGALESGMAHWVLQDLQDRLGEALDSIQSVQRIIDTVHRQDGHTTAAPLPAVAADRVSSQRHS